MDEQALRAFLSLAQTENTRDTAAELAVNQSNVSRALARLEASIGMPLFARHGKRLELNANGVAFRADAAAVLDAYESARRHAETIADAGRLLRIGFLHSLARWLVPDVVGTFRATQPDVRVTLRQGFSRDLQGGRLVRLFEAQVELGSYWLTRLKTRRETAAMLAFRSWLVSRCLAP